MWGWLGGMLTSTAVGALAVVLILSGIAFNTSATSPHSKILAWAIHKTMIHSVKRRAEKVPPLPPPTRAALLSGVAEYERHCIACHGGPGVMRARWVSAMLPTPPFLLDASARWSPQELYTIVHDGVKMTGMPAWGQIESDARIAEIVAFLEVMPRLTPHRFAEIRRRIGGGPLARSKFRAVARKKGLLARDAGSSADVHGRLASNSFLLDERQIPKKHVTMARIATECPRKRPSRHCQHLNRDRSG